MDKLSAQTQVHLSNYRRVIKDIENLEQFHDAKVLAISSTVVSKKPAVSFGSTPSKTKPVDTMYSNSSESDGSWYPGKNYVPDTPEPETPRQAKCRMWCMWGNDPR